MDASGSVPVRENFIKNFCSQGLKKKSGRRTEIGVLVVGFSQIQALKKHNPLVFTSG